MEAFKSLQSYWRRRSYQRIEKLPAKRKVAVVRLGGGEIRRRPKFLKVVVVVLPVKKLKLLVPKKLMARVRDAYMDAMLSLAGESGVAANKIGGGPVWDRRIPRARQASSKGGDFEKKIMLHLYSSVIATR